MALLFGVYLFFAASVCLYLFWFASIASQFVCVWFSDHSALFNDLERFFLSCRCHRCYSHVFNQQQHQPSPKQKKIIQMQYVFTYGFVSCIFCTIFFLLYLIPFFFSVVRDDEYSSIIAVSQLFFFFFRVRVLRFFIFPIYICFVFFSVVVGCQMKYFIGLSTFMWIKRRKRKKKTR